MFWGSRRGGGGAGTDHNARRSREVVRIFLSLFIPILAPRKQHEKWSHSESVEEDLSILLLRIEDESSAMRDWLQWGNSKEKIPFLYWWASRRSSHSKRPWIRPQYSLMIYLEQQLCIAGARLFEKFRKHLYQRFVSKQLRRDQIYRSLEQQSHLSEIVNYSEKLLKQTSIPPKRKTLSPCRIHNE